MSTRGPLNPDALRRAVRASGVPLSLAKVVVQAYLDGVSSKALAKNPRVQRLAAMKVGQQIIWEDTTIGYLQTVDKRRARVLMEEPAALWISSSHDGMCVVRRVA